MSIANYIGYKFGAIFGRYITSFPWFIYSELSQLLENICKKYLDFGFCELFLINHFFNPFSCPYFRNEVGGEVDRVVALTRETAAKRFQSGQPMGSTGGSGSNDQVNFVYFEQQALHI